ncbi:hypothetical protein NSQ59_14085 [Margalitia sp. FSL K6-0131]|uniref:hypothetical protein n=1 Tax=Margalitia sp. FSL K6-0131 TaxID=2954604 RepID=UPI0030F743D2
MLVREMYENLILYEESTLAHSLYHLLAEEKISLDDDISKIDMNQVNPEKVAELVEKNVLGIHKIGVYSLKMDKKTFVFIYASSEEEAIQFYRKSFHKNPLNCHEYSLDFELTRGNGVISFREMRKEFTQFPAVAGYYVKETLGGFRRFE